MQQAEVTLINQGISKTSVKSRVFRKYSNYLFVLPALCFLLVFMFFPVFYNILLSSKDVNVMNLKGEQHFVGFANYITVFKDDLFAISLKNSTIFTGLSIIFQFVIGFALALFFNKKFPGRDIMRSLMLLAWMMPIVITATLFKWMLAGDYGVINYLIESVGIIHKPISWLTESSTSLYGTIMANIWIGIPFNMIILLSGLQSLPDHLYEAAKIDGASRFQQFIHITLPLMRPTILVLLMLGLIYTFKVFDLIFIMTGGGPVNSSFVLPLYAYQLAFSKYDFSLGATVASIMFAILIVLAGIYLWMLRKEEQVI